MAGGTSLNLFTEFVDITGPTYLTGPKDVVNDAQKTNYGTLGYMLRGQGMSDVLQGGATINDYVYLQAVRRSRSYKPNEKQTYDNTQTGTTWSADWRFFLTDMVWTDEEIILNAGGTMSREAKFQAYKDLYWRKQQQVYTDQMNYWEEILWAVPDSTAMEVSGTGSEMYSIPTFITQNDPHTAGASAAAASQIVQTGSHPLMAASTAWSGNVAGIDPDAASSGGKWANTLVHYGTGGAGFTTASLENVIHALDIAFHAVDFRPPPMFQEYYENPQAQQKPGPFIACSLEGKTKLMFLYRESKDTWVDMKDPFFNPTYAGAPIVYTAQLDTAALYNLGGTALATEAAATITGPRYYGIQPQYLRPVFHTDRYFTSLGVMTDLEQPTTHVMPINTYAQLCPRSRNRHFMVAPLASN